MSKIFKSLTVLLVLLFSISTVSAKTLTERLADGHKLRLGFGTAVPWAYAGDGGEALGFVNMIALTVLEEMGITEHETKVFEWSGLIPGLNADRADMITGGMYILKSRCANMDFSDPIGVFGDAMLVPKGNPKNINNYADVISTGAKLVTGTGFNTVEAAKKYDRAVVVDTIGVKDRVKRAQEVSKLGVEFVELHAGLDEQAKPGYSIDVLIDEASKAGVPVSIAGGVNKNSIAKVKASGAVVAVAGGAIYGAEDPAAAAKELKEALS